MLIDWVRQQNMKLWNDLKRKMLAHPRQTVCENESELSYNELIASSELFAQQLAGLRSCAVLCRSEFMAAQALLACFAAEVTAVPLSERYGKLHFSKILEKISPDALITDEGGRLSVKRSENSRYRVPNARPALIMCTSGTTGVPKGAMLTEENILSNVSDIAEYFDIGIRDTILIARPLYHCAVLTGEFLTALVKGASIRFCSEAFNPSGMPKLIREYGITVFCGTPTLLGLMIRFVQNGETLPLRHIAVSGEGMNRETGLGIAEALPNAKIYHVYGLTEACPRVSYLPPELFRAFPDCVGIPLKSVRLRIAKKNGIAAVQGEKGLLYVSGNNVMAGYYGEPEKTADILKDGWLCTGDIAAITPEGLLKIYGRSDDLIIKAGMNIYPQEIEGALKADRRVHEVLAYGYDSAYGTQIGLKIAGDFSAPEEVKSLCAELLPPYQMPVKIEVLKELEKNGSGKIKRKGNHD